MSTHNRRESDPPVTPASAFANLLNDALRATGAIILDPSNVPAKYRLLFDEAAPTPVPVLPAVVGETPLIGYRMWRIWPCGRLSLLASTTRDDLWPVGEAMETDVAPTEHVPPYLAEVHGIHAYTTRIELERYRVNMYGADRARAIAPHIVAGTVALWGRVVECERGYRATYAYPQKLFAHPGLEPERLQALARLYGCEVG